MRVNAFLARAGVASRRGADELVKRGDVRVNGQTAQLNTLVNDGDNVEVNGKKVKAQKLRYILLHKPVGYMSTLNDPEGRRKITDLVRINERVVPIGRLDFNTSGLIILTNDGVLARNLMHPSSGVEKTYELKVYGRISKELLNTLSNGVKLDDGLTRKATATQASGNIVRLTIKEGRNRQVRRMAEAVDLKLKSLKRIKYGLLELNELKPGQWRDISDQELTDLRKMVQ